MKNICFITGTRADYGILAPVMRNISASKEANLQIVATNMHLSPKFGMTVNEIEADGFHIDFKIESLEDNDSAEAIVRSMAKVESGLAKAFTELKPDIVVILGDRYEALAAASAAVVFNIPVAHLHGGETTEGAIDDKFRHAITKLSDYHFAATREYVEKIVSMGELPENVFHSGAPGAEIRENETPEDIESKAVEFYSKTGINPWEPYILLAFHPVTLLPDKGTVELKATLEALDTFINQGYKVLVTMPNSDPGNMEVTGLLQDWGNRHSAEGAGRVVNVKSLGSELFHFAMETAACIVGNSSAALIEAPSHRLPSVNVGIRQKGRAHGVTVLNAAPTKERIKLALEAALSMEMKGVILGQPVSALNPYYKENSATFIAKKLINILKNEKKKPI